jgi:hypothetical protein
MKTCTDAREGVWWEGAAVGEIQALVKRPAMQDAKSSDSPRFR